MISGIVYFDEILEAVKDETGIENIMNFQEKIKRFVFRAEWDIAPMGTIVRKQKTYALNDGYYDGKYMILPYDFTSEYAYEKINTAYFRGDKLELFEDYQNAETVTLQYMGFVLDSLGRPVTTQNHFDAVVAHCVWKLYAPKVFLGSGDKQQLREFKNDYETLVMASRGNDAFPTEEDWAQIGQTLRSSSADLLEWNCGTPILTTGLDGGTPEIPGPGDGTDCGNITVDMISIFESNLIT